MDTEASNGIVPRTAALADRVVKVALALPRHAVGFELSRQLVRCGTSVGANVEEAQAGESRADFLHKMRIARKECRELEYFLRRISNAELLPPARLSEITDESNQVLRILTSIIRSADGAGRGGQTRRKGSKGSGDAGRST